MLQVRQSGPVLFLTLDRPEVRNAFNSELIARLTEQFGQLAPEVRAVVVAGEGKAFCAGGDLEWMRSAAGYSEEENFQDAMKLAELFEAIAQCPAVVIAKIHGAAFGGGCGVVAAADVAIAEQGTKFCFSEVRLGLVPATISRYVLPKIGSGNARWLFTTAQVFESDVAARVGLVHTVAPAGGMDAAVGVVLSSLLACGPLAVANSKRLALEGPYPLEQGARLLASARSGQEGKEGVAAFLDKRPASFVVDSVPQ